VLLGSSASLLALVHSETVQSEFVPTRPFRVNAGSPHSYILMADGSTKYLSELAAGDAVLAVAGDGSARRVTLGRLKIETRPLLKVDYTYTLDVDVDGDGMSNPSQTSQTHTHTSHTHTHTSHVFLQQAETVRLIGTDGPRSVTDVSVGWGVMGWRGRSGRHLGNAIPSRVEER
jgi:3-dehydroquinate synthase II